MKNKRLPQCFFNNKTYWNEQTFYSVSFQAFNWLLCNVTQTTSLHDILWHFVASLTPSPFDTEEEEDEETKGNKENLEQVSKQC